MPVAPGVRPEDRSTSARHGCPEAEGVVLAADGLGVSSIEEPCDPTDPGARESCSQDLKKRLPPDPRAGYNDSASLQSRKRANLLKPYGEREAQEQSGELQRAVGPLGGRFSP